MKREGRREQVGLKVEPAGLRCRACKPSPTGQLLTRRDRANRHLTSGGLDAVFFGLSFLCERVFARCIVRVTFCRRVGHIDLFAVDSFFESANRFAHRLTEAWQTRWSEENEYDRNEC